MLLNLFSVDPKYGSLKKVFENNDQIFSSHIVSFSYRYFWFLIFLPALSLNSWPKYSRVSTSLNLLGRGTTLCLTDNALCRARNAPQSGFFPVVFVLTSGSFCFCLCFFSSPF